MQNAMMTIPQPANTLRHLLTRGATTGSRLHVVRQASVETQVKVPTSETDAKFADFKCTTAIMFPGQGAQSVGMAADVCNEVPAAKQLFEHANDILGYDLLALCTEGPKEKLDSTVYSQPALYVASLAAIEKLKTMDQAEVLQSAEVTLGLSLGEYTALTFAGALSFEDGLKLVALRGASMQSAAEMQPSGMVSVVGLSVEQVGEVCAKVTAQVGEDKSIKIANYLCPGNYACSGSKEACALIGEVAKEAGAKMTVPLAVAGAFHTQYMQPAYIKLSEALASTSVKEPRIPVVSNVDAMPHADPEVIKQILALQLTSPVQMETSLKTLIDRGLEKGYELGPGKVISGLMRRVNRKIPITNISV